MTRKRLSLFSRLFISFLLFLFVPLITTALLTNAFIIGQYKENLLLINGNSLDDAAEILNEKMKSCLNSAVSLAELPYSQTLETYYEGPMDGQVQLAANRMMGQIGRVLSYDDLYSDMLIYFYHSDSIVSSEGFYSLKAYLEQYLSLTDETPFSWRDRTMQAETFTLGAVEQNRYDLDVEGLRPGELIPLLIPHPLIGQKTKTLAFYLSREKFSRLLSRGETSGLGVVILYLPEKDYAVPSRELKPEEKRLFDRIKTRSSFSETLDTDGGAYTSLVRPFPSFGWKIISLTPTHQLLLAITKIRLVLVVITGIVLIVGALLSYFLASRIYRPVGEITRSIHDQLLGDDHDGERDEFSLIGFALDSTFSENRSLTQRYEKNLPLLRERFFGRILSGALTDEEEISLREEELEIAFPHDGFLIGLISVNGLGKLEADDPDIPVSAYYQLISDAMGDGLPRDMGVQCFLRLRYLACLVNYNREIYTTPEAFVPYFEKIRDRVNGDTGLHFCLVLSEPVRDILEWRQAWKDAGDLYSRYRYDCENRIILPDAPREGGPFLFSLETEGRLENLLKAGRAEDCSNLIGEIVRDNARSTGKNAEYLELVFRQILTIPIGQIFQRKGTLRQVFKEGRNVFKALLSRETIEDSLLFLCEKYKEYIDWAQVQDGGRQPRKEAVMAYIEGNYTRDFSLDEIAAHFSLSPAYFSRFFKELMGSTMVSYLNSYRIGMAKKLLLEEPDLSIGETAGRVGFNIYHTFARTFKRYAGVTPEQYRKNHHIV